MEEASFESVDLVDICRRAISAWQYIDQKLTTEKITRIDKNYSYPNPSSFSNISARNVTEAVTKDLKCTKFTLERDLMTEIILSEKRVEDRRKSTTTVKNFFNISGKEELSCKKKQLIYWQIRLRYACGIVPIAILKMIPDLKRMGYKFWKLPDGGTVPFSSTWLGDLVIVPKRYNIVELNVKIGDKVMDVITEPIHGLGGYEKEGPFTHHSVIVVQSNPDDKSLHILDPTSLQFSLEGQNSSLIAFSPWKDYVENFPGSILATDMENDGDAKSRLERKWTIGNLIFNHCKKLIYAILKDFDKAACNHCGDVPANTKSNTQLLMCAACKTTKYCDKHCQKLAWKSHKVCCSV